MTYTKTICVCDRCGKSISDNDWKMGLMRDARISEHASLSAQVNNIDRNPRNYDLCRKCSKELDKFMVMKQ